MSAKNPAPRQPFRPRTWLVRCVGLLILLSIIAYFGVYTALVTPKRFFQCLAAPIDFINRYYGKETGATLPTYTSGNQVKLLVNGNEGMAAMLDLVDHAQHTIRWQVMYFQPDEAGQRIAEALTAAAKRGVKVQFAFDKENSVEGSVLFPLPEDQRERWGKAMDGILKQFSDAGVTVLDSGSGLDYNLDNVSAEARAMQQGVSGTACVGINHYDHRKILIADGQRAVVGGMNVGNEYIYQNAPDPTKDMLADAADRKATGQPETWAKWFDTSVQVQGPVIARLISEFNTRWEVLGGKPLPTEIIDSAGGDVRLYAAFQRPGFVECSTAYLTLIQNAKKDIYIASPYVTYEPLLNALMDASKRGVHVVFVFPDKYNDADTSTHIFRAHEGDMVAAGIEMYNNNLRMAHSKIMVVDDQLGVVGSFNLDHRAWTHNFEDAMVIDNAAFAQEMVDRVFKMYISASVRVTDTKNGPLKFTDWLFQTFA